MNSLAGCSIASMCDGSISADSFAARNPIYMSLKTSALSSFEPTRIPVRGGSVVSAALRHCGPWSAMLGNVAGRRHSGLIILKYSHSPSFREPNDLQSRLKVNSTLNSGIAECCPRMAECLPRLENYHRGGAVDQNRTREPTEAKSRALRPRGRWP